MTIYKTVVSWLAFLFLAYVVVKRSFQLIWREVLLELSSIDPDRWRDWTEGLSVSHARIADIWHALFWIIVTLMIVTPWMRSWWSRRRKSVRLIPLDDPPSVWLNMAGRWICALIYLDHLFHWLPFHPSEFMRKLNPDYASGQDMGEFFADIFRPYVLGIGTALLISPELTRLASSGFTGFIDAVFFPGGREKLPPYTLKLARFYLEKQRWEEAEAEYARMLSFYPDRPEAWQERLALAFQRPAPAVPAPAEVLSEGFRALSLAADREELHRRFTELAS